MQKINRTTRQVMFLFLLATVGLARGGTITVGTGAEYDYATIQAAIDAAVDQDVVLVMPDTYNVQEPITFKGKAITVQSQDGPETTTIRMGTPTDSRQGSVVAFADGEGPESVLTGFTIAGGTGTLIPGSSDSYWGGGVYCYRASPTIQGNVIVGNDLPPGTADTFGIGGGIGCYESDATIVGNVVKNNTAYLGGGIYIYIGDARVSSNLICGNSARVGGGIFLQPWGQFIQLISNTLVANSALSGGNVYGTGRCRIVNNIMTNGTATYGGGLRWFGIGPPKQHPIAYNNIYDNTGGDYYGLENQTGSNGNISEDPLFQSPDTNDYHLQPDSPCISAADPAFVPGPNETDIDGDPRVLGRRADIGADEYVGYVQPIADAGPDQLMNDLPESVTLDGSGSYFYDSNGTKQFHWTQIDGPTVGLSDANSVQASFVPSELGICVFELQVSDAFAESLPDDVTVAVGTDYIPVADAGLPRYAAADPVKLDGTGSYDPDKSGGLSYMWRQIFGPSLTITDSNTATPTISGFTQTSVIQRCEFELVVSDGSYDSLPDTVEVKIVPSFGVSSLVLENASFDPEKPTVIYFGGGDCVDGYSGQPWNNPEWSSRANVIGFPGGYSPDYDPAGGLRRYYRCGDMIIAYLSSVAPDYKQPIQTMGFSTGGQPAVDVGAYLNLTYADHRYAVNRVVSLDIGCRSYIYSFNQLLASSVDGEQCWSDAYWRYNPSATGQGHLRVGSNLTHRDVRNWYRNSLTGSDMNQFNDGVVAGAYWSVVGPGKNLQLNTQGQLYYFSWTGGTTSGYMTLYDESQYPAKLPEPVTLLDPVYVKDDRGYILTCEESQNAVGYELLVGSDPHRVMDYEVISDTPAPPNEATKILEDVWWTVKVRDAYGSTIHADPQYITPTLDIFDLKRDGRLDFKDFAVLAGYWHQNEPSVDIGPPPYGDDIIDYRDLAALAGHWLEDNNP